MPECASHVGYIWRPAITSQYHHAGQRFQSAVITFGIYHTDTVALEDHLFAHKSGDQGFAGVRLADD